MGKQMRKKMLRWCPQHRAVHVVVLQLSCVCCWSTTTLTLYHLFVLEFENIWTGRGREKRRNCETTAARSLWAYCWAVNGLKICVLTIFYKINRCLLFSHSFYYYYSCPSTKKLLFWTYSCCFSRMQIPKKFLRKKKMHFDFFLNRVVSWNLIYIFPVPNIP